MLCFSSCLALFFLAVSQASLMGLSNHSLSLLTGTSKASPSDLHHRPPHSLEDIKPPFKHEPHPFMDDRVSFSSHVPCSKWGPLPTCVTLLFVLHSVQSIGYWLATSLTVYWNHLPSCLCVIMPLPSVTGEVYSFPRCQLIFNFDRRAIYHSKGLWEYIPKSLPSVCLSVPRSSNEIVRLLFWCCTWMDSYQRALQTNGKLFSSIENIESSFLLNFGMMIIVVIPT